MKLSIPTLLAMTFLSALSHSVLSMTEEEKMAEMQKKLNQEVFEKPFSVEDEERIDAFIKDAMERDLKPVKKAPEFWKRGYTCADIYSYGWRYYQNCRYHHRYYGRYWF